MKATLTYHSIDNSRSPVSVSEEVFQAHLRWLTSGRVETVSLRDLVTRPAAAPDAVSVTFDDGFVNSRSAVERLLDCGIPVTVFVASRHVGGTNAWGGTDQARIPTLQLLSWSDLEHLLRRGASIESHSLTHPRMTQLSDSALEEELAKSQDDLRIRLGVESAHVAYPYGDVDERVAARGRKFYAFGHTMEMRAMDRAGSPMQLPRLDLYYYQVPGALEAWGQPAFRRRLSRIRLQRRIRRLVRM